MDDYLKVPKIEERMEIMEQERQSEVAAQSAHNSKYLFNIYYIYHKYFRII